jgi:hypothetical protein
MTVDTDHPGTWEHADLHVAQEPWWRGPLAFLVAVVGALALVAAVLFTVAIIQGRDPAQHPVERSTFTDSFGRQCTALRAGDAVALDCDYKPVESRLGSLLEGSQP